MPPPAPVRLRPLFTRLIQQTHRIATRVSWRSIACQLLSLLLTYALLLQLVPRVTIARPAPPQSFPEKQVAKSTDKLTPNLLEAGAEGIWSSTLLPLSGCDGPAFSGITGLNSVTISASSAYVDSFDSLIGYSASHSSQANLLSNGQIDLKGAKTYGNVVSTQANVILESGSLVTGDVQYATTLKNSGSVQGAITKQTSSLLTAALPGACGTYRSAPTASDNWIIGNYTYDQTRGDLTVSGGNTAALADGAYCLHNLTLSGGSTLRVNGPVAINLTGQLNTSGGSLSNTTYLPANLQISTSYTGNNGVTLSGGSSAYLTIYAPGTSVTLSGGSPLFGALLGKTLTVSGNSVIHYDIRLRDTCPPNITIISPANNATTTSATLVVNGTAFDNGTNDTGVTSVTVNGAAATYDPANGTWSISGIALALGSNTITAVVTDNTGNQSSAQILVTRQVPNQPPTVNAGLDQTITLPAQANLNGSVSDDGFPTGTTSTTTWSKVSGPGNVTFANPNVTITTASFSAAGTYVLRLTASDSQLSASDEITITANPQNQPPTVNAGADQTITLPITAQLSGNTTDDGLPAGSSLSVAWSKISGPGTVTFTNPNAAVTNASFSLAGTYTLRLTASDSELSSTDDVVVVVIAENHSPDVTAGPDQTITLPNSANLNGSVSDDALPQGSSVSTVWSIVSGPGTVTFANPNVTVTSASFSVAGAYVLRLTASDSDLTASDDISVTVIPENRAPTVNAGADQIVELPNQASLSGIVADDGLPAGSTPATDWTKVSGPGTVTFANSAATTTNASFGLPGTYVLRLSASDSELTTSDDLTITVDPENQPPNVSAGADQTITLPATAGLNGAVTDDGWPRDSSVSISWSQVSGPGTATFTAPNAAVTAVSFSAAGTYVLRLTATDSQLGSSDDIQIVVIPENHAPTSNAGPDQTITLPAQASLNGTVSDDGLPSGSTLTSAWSKVSGPGTVTFANANAAITTAVFSEAGSYVLRLTANDSQLNGSDDVQFTVIPENHAPTVNAGADLTITLPSDANLNGAVSDDGLPAGCTVTITWSKVSGPGTVTFANGNAAITAASFSQAGSYLLRLAATDSQLNSSDDVQVNVNPPNQAPTVNAGVDQTITLPWIANLQGTAIDDGAPAGSVLTLSWSMVSGPASVSFANPQVPATTAAFMQAGTYTLRLTVSDSEFTRFDDVTIVADTNFCATLAPGIIAWWTGDNNANDLANGHHGLLRGGATFANGVVNQGFKLDGVDDYVEIPDSADFKPANVTVDTWVKFDGLNSQVISASQGQQYIVFKKNTRSGAFEGYTLYKFRQNGVDKLGFAVASSAGVQASVTSQTSVVAGQVYHLAGTYDRNRVKLYVNGVLEGEQPATFALDYGNRPVFLGTTGETNWDGKLNGVIDEADIFSRALSASEIQEIYLAGSAGKCKTPVNHPPKVNAGSDQVTNLPGPVNLPGSATDDGLPGNSLTTSWSKVSGPGNVVFGNSAAAVTNASFDALGVYVLRLTASDTQLSASDDVQVTVVPENHPPTANAGPDQEITLLTSASLDGSVSDDGLPAGSTLTTNWSKVSGPGAVTFADPSVTMTTASFSAPGSYVLRLSVSDSQLSATDELTVTVAPVCAEVHAGLVGWWPGEGNTLDLVSLQQGQLKGGATFASAVVNQGFKFDGVDDVVEVPDSPELRPARLTVETWVRFDNLNSQVISAPQGFQYVVFKKNTRTGQFEGYTILKQRQNGVEKLIFAVSSATGNQAVATSQTNIVAGQFYHVAGTYDGSQVRIYINGVLESQTAASFPLDYSNRPLFLGSTGETFWDGKLNGVIDEASIFDRALTSSEIFNIYQAGNKGKCPLPINSAPTVNAGPDLITSIDAVLELHGTMVDDGLPAGRTVTTSWTKVSGPGTVAFSDLHQPTTNVTFSATGAYVLRLTANDSQLSNTDEVNVTVTEPPYTLAASPSLVLIGNPITVNWHAPAGRPLNDRIALFRVGDPNNSHIGYQYTQGAQTGTMTFLAPSAPDRYEFRYLLENTNTSTATSGVITVVANLNGATLTLDPPSAGPNVTNTSQTLRATFKDSNNQPISNFNVNFVVIGPNATSFTAVTDAAGVALFSYVGNQSGTDTVQAKVSLNEYQLASNNSTINWVTPVQAISTTTVLGRFFTNLNNQGVFTTQPNETPVFSQNFPTISFNPPPNTILNNTSGVNESKRPFTNVTTDLNGSFTGTIIAQGNGLQAGVGTLFNFSAVFTAKFTVASAGDITFNFFSDDGFIFGVGNGATRVSGALSNPPASGLTPFEQLPVMGAYNLPTAPVANSVTVHFPAAGTYSYEVDYTECCAGELAIIMTTAASGNHAVPPTVSLALSPISVGPKNTGQQQTFNVTAVDASGEPLRNFQLQLAVAGANIAQLQQTTDQTGHATFTYTGVNPGADSVQASAPVGNTTAYSNVVTLQWLPAPNQAPVAQAGPDQTTLLSVGVQLNGSVSDDGLPVGSQVTTNWTKLSGPGTVTFLNANATMTGAQFSAIGTYVLRLTASDGALNSSDDVTVTVNADNQPPSVNAGPDQTVFLPNKNVGFFLNDLAAFNAAAGNPSVAVDFDSLAPGTNITGTTLSGVTFALPGAAGSSAPLIVTRASDTFTPNTFSGLIDPATNKLPATSGANVLSPGGPELGPGFNPTLENDDLRITFAQPVSAVGFDLLFQELDFFSAVRVTFFDVNGNVLYFNDNLPDGSGQGGGAPGGSVFVGFVSTRANIATIVIDEYDDNNTFPDCNIGFDTFRVQRLIPTTAIVNLSGIVSDDGLPPNSTVSSAWTKVSGPGSVTFDDPAQRVTKASFSAAGSYVLRLTSSDSELSGSDDVVITVNEGTVNFPPTVNAGNDQTITLPTNSVTLSGSATDDGKPVGSTLVTAWSVIGGPGNVTFGNAASLSTTATFAATGTYVLRLTAGDSQLNATDELVVTVNALVTNQPPLVNAGADQSISLPATANLQGSASDDGLPVGALTVSWSKISGPGSVTFGNPSAAVTAATFGASGVYVLRLTASDTVLSANDEVQITVAEFNLPPTTNAGSDQTVALNANQVANGGSEDQLVNDKVPGWIEVQGTTWTRASANSGSGFPAAQRGSAYFYSGNTAQAELRQDVDLSAYASGIAAGTQEFELQVYLRSAAETLPDSGQVVLEYRNATNTSMIASLNSGAITSTTGWHLTEDRRVPPAGTGWIRIRLIATRNTGAASDASNDAFFDSVSLRPIGAAAVKLNGTVNDDGLPSGTSLTAAWNMVSGPAPVTFTNPNAAVNSATFTTAGIYVLRLSASDGPASASDDVSIIVNPANQPPAVSAGANQTITLPATATLNGVVTDDGQPSGSSVSVSWSKVSGPGVATFTNPNQAITSAIFSAGGTYVLRLTADDTEYDNSAQVTITVNQGSGPVNQPPSVNPGPNQTISLPTDTVTLNGTVTDDGLPAGSTLTITWTKVSGPGVVTFGNANSAVTMAQLSAVGSYVLRLSASDGAFLVSHDVGVNLTPAGAQNQPPTANAGPDQTALLSQGAQLDGSASDDGLPAGGNLTTHWTKVSGPGNVSFLNPNVTITGANFSAIGTYVLRLAVSDTALTASDDITITVIDDVAPPTVEITAPTDGSSVTDRTPVTGSVSGGDWLLEYSLASDDNPANRVWTTFGSGSGATSGNLGTLDPTMMLNGLFTIRLSATDSYGQTSRTSINVIIEGNLKVGNFTLSFTDLSIPVAGVPMEVSRTYDSRDKRVGDFGFGWSLGLRNIRVEKSGVIGLKWYETASQEVFPNYCLQPLGSNIVSVTFPGGKVFKFKATTAPQCQRFAPITGGTVSFTPMPGTHGTLQVIGSSDFQIDGSVPGPVNLVGFGGGVDIFNSFVFKFTAEDGTAYVVDQRSGLQSVADLSGNTVTIGAGGIVHSNGKSITFTRDSLGRIASITDPGGNSQTYTYDANGDLVSYTDAENNTSTYTYDATHRLLTINDPRGIQPIRNDYDAAGRLISHTDGFGKVFTYNHDIAGRIETLTDRLGRITTLEYDNRGNVLRKTDARGGVTSFTYDPNDNVLTETNAIGKTTTFTYDALDHRTSITDPLGNVTQFSYNGLGKVLTTTDPLGNVTTNTYNGAGKMLTTKDALNNETTYTYSIFDGQLISSTSPLNGTSNYTYTGGYLTKAKDPLGNETTFTYDANSNRASQTFKRTNAQGQLETFTTSYEHDKLSRLKKTTFPDGSFAQIEYNAIGQKGATIDQSGRRTEYSYDAMGHLTRTTYPNGAHEDTTYDEEGRRLTTTDRGGRMTSYHYDELGRLTKTTFANGTFVQTAFDAIGRVSSTTDTLGHITTYEYDPNCGCSSRRSKITDSLGHITTFVYDAAGRQTSMTDSLGHTITNEYDAIGRLVKTIYPDSTFDLAEYNAMGQVVKRTDQAGKSTQFAFDAVGNLIKVTDALGQETRYAYDELGEQTEQTDASNHTARYEYDNMGRRTKRTLPLGQFETYAYASDGLVTSRTDFNGKTTTYSYDTIGRLITKTPDASLNQPLVTFTYSQTGRRLTMQDASGATSYSYDTRDRLLSKQTPQGTLSYTYDDAGDLLTTRSSNSNGVSLDYGYDALNRLSTVKDNNLVALNGGVTTYGFDPVGNLQSYQNPNGVGASYSYNSLNRLTSMTMGTGTTQLASYSYTLGPTGNRTAVAELGGRSVTYHYDDLYRLTSESIANDPQAINGSISYGYDAVGNRLSRSSTVSGLPSQSASYDANDRLASASYDSNGNTLVANGNNYAYDFEDRLSSASGGATYVYDGDGNRISRTASGVTTRYLVDTNNHTGLSQVVDEINSGVVTRSYANGLGLISQRQIVGSQWQVSFYGYDGQGSVRQLTDASGSVTDTYTYDAFGNVIARTGTTPNERLYVGAEQFDANLGFYFLRARYMDPSSGRFMTQDSYEGDKYSPMSLHKYLYAHSSPANFSDPTGHMSIAGQVAAIAVAGIIASMAIFGTFTSLTQRYLPKDAFRSDPDGVVFGFQVAHSVGRNIPLRNPFTLGLRLGLWLLAGVYGADALVRFSNPGTAWLYAYGGLSSGLGQNLNGVTATGYVGFVWGVSEPGDYEKWFFCSTLTPHSLSPGLGVSSSFPVSVCSSPPKDNGDPGAYSVTMNVATTRGSARSTGAAQASGTYYRYLQDIPFGQAVPRTIQGVQALWETVSQDLEP